MKTIFFCAVAVSLAWALDVSGETLLAETVSLATFEVYSVDNATYAVGSADEIASLPKVAFRKGETVTATPCAGAPSTLVASAESAGAVAFAPDAGGVWVLANSGQGTARIGVAWHVYGDGGTLAESSGVGPYGIDSIEGGPGRKTPRRNALPIAYSGDNWAGNPSKPAVLTVVSPDGVETGLAFSGTGAFPFPFDSIGKWKVRLSAAGMSQEAELDLYGGFVTSIR